MNLGLCLAGGGVKGAAHIGVIKALEEQNIKFDSVAGTSSGSIVATLYSCGYNADEIYKLFKKYASKIKYIDFKNILKIIYGVIFKRRLIVDGLNSGDVIEKIINESCEFKGIYNINQIKTKLLIPAIDSESGKVCVFNSCGINTQNEQEKYISDISIGKAVRASSSYPIVFSPCKVNNKELLDGGIKENVPWKELEYIGCDKIFSVNFYSKNKKKCCDNIIDIAQRTLELINEELDRHEINEIDFLHTIELNDVSLLEVEKIDEIYQEGYRQTKNKINDIIKYLK